MRPYWRPAATVSGDDKWTSRRVATAGRSNVAAIFRTARCRHSAEVSMAFLAVSHRGACK